MYNDSINFFKKYKMKTTKYSRWNTRFSYNILLEILSDGWSACQKYEIHTKYCRELKNLIFLLNLEKTGDILYLCTE